MLLDFITTLPFFFFYLIFYSFISIFVSTLNIQRRFKSCRYHERHLVNSINGVFQILTPITS